MPDPDPREKADDQTTNPAPGVAIRPNQGVEIGGPKGPEPTRYGDWEKNGRCIDF